MAVEPELSIKDLLDTDFLQKIQDDFAEIAGVGSIIYDLEGNPLTKPSNFTGYCRLIRSSPKGQQKCIQSDAELAMECSTAESNAIVCRSGRLMDGIAPIIVEGRQIANWGIGQVLFEERDEGWVRAYAREIEVPEDALVEEFRKLKIMPRENFLRVIQYLMTLSREVSEITLANYRLKDEIQKRIKTQERYSAIVKNAIVGICEITNNGVLDYVNDQMCELSGYPRAELVGRHINTILKSDRDFASYFNGITDYANRSYANVGYDFYGVMNRKDEGSFPCRVCMTPQTNLSKQVVKSSAVIIDISSEIEAHRKLESSNRELLESKKQIDLFFDNNQNGLCIYDKKINRIKYNPAYREFVKEIGKEHALSSGELWEPIEESMLRKVIAGEVNEFEIKKEYGVQLYSIKASPIIDYSKEIIQLLITVADITDYQVMMEQSFFAERMAGIGMLASGIAHDMKGLFSILGNANHTLRRMVSDAETPDIAKMQRTLTIQEEGLNNGRKLLAGLLSFSGKRSAKTENFSLNTCVEDILRIYNSIILSKNAEIEIDVRSSVILNCHQSKIIQVIMNVFSNALEAVEQNGKIQLFESCSPGFFRFSIKDNGKGIDEKSREAIFKAFYSTKKDGTGLGLFLVKNIVFEIGGKLSVDSIPGEGSVFTLEIPDNDNFSTTIEQESAM